jgi:hypothetical protein
VFASGLWSPVSTLPDLAELERIAERVLASAARLVAEAAPDLPAFDPLTGEVVSS